VLDCGKGGLGSDEHCLSSIGLSTCSREALGWNLRGGKPGLFASEGGELLGQARGALAGAGNRVRQRTMARGEVGGMFGGAVGGAVSLTHRIGGDDGCVLRSFGHGGMRCLLSGEARSLLV
jgi:hypothetical protein